MSAFVPLAVPGLSEPTRHIEIHLARGPLQATVQWPVSEAGACVAWLREWLATEPLDMRAGTETALARVVAVFGVARPYHAYCFANRRATRIKVLVHDGIGVWPIAETLHRWLIAQRQRVPDGSGTARSINYSLKRWVALTRYLDDGQAPIDNN